MSDSAANHYNALHRDKLVAENVGLKERIKELEKAAWAVVEYVDLPLPGERRYSETDWATVDKLKQILLGGGENG